MLARGFDGQVLRYAGTIFPGIAAIVATELKGCSRTQCRDWLADAFADMMAEWLGGATQDEWRRKIAAVRVDNPNLKHASAAAQLFTTEWLAFIEAEMGE